jgi:type 1 glutamine amidotransferase
MIKHFVFLLISFCFFTSASCNNFSKKKIKVLIIDGQNNHKVWPKSTIMMKQYLEETGMFTVDVSRTQFLYGSEDFKEWLSLAGVSEGVEGKPKIDPNFNPDFFKYDVVVSNFGWKAAPWPNETKANFEKYLKNGGGFVSVHAADNCFPEWPAYNEAIGIGGWDRNEKSGPYLYIDENNQVKKDYSAGIGGKHAKREEFLITTYNKEHPITKGMPLQWMHSVDECYAYLRGPAENVTILATAVSTLKDPSLQQKEPMVMTIDYGKGRVFHTTLGHDSISNECVGFITLLERGVEWAATGQVTQTELPSDFPTATAVSVRDFEYKK